MTRISTTVTEQLQRRDLRARRPRRGRRSTSSCPSSRWRLLFPVLIFIGTATRLSAARREQRFAAMRLVGATPRQISRARRRRVDGRRRRRHGRRLRRCSSLLRPVAGAIPFTGAPFFPGDLSLGAAGHRCVVALGVPVAAAVAARLALRRVSISPLGVSRRVTPRPPRAWRLIPLRPASPSWRSSDQSPAARATTPGPDRRRSCPASLLVMAGLVIAGPWLTMVGARLWPGGPAGPPR